jgi:HAMP domain-containing protein
MATTGIISGAAIVGVLAGGTVIMDAQRENESVKAQIEWSGDAMGGKSWMELQQRASNMEALLNNYNAFDSSPDNPTPREVLGALEKDLKVMKQQLRVVNAHLDRVDKLGKENERHRKIVENIMNEEKPQGQTDAEKSV